MYKESIISWFSENETLLRATEFNTISHFLIYQNWADLNTDGADTRRLGSKPLPEPMLIYCQLEIMNKFSEIRIKVQHFSFI